jgi:serine/threonine-protein kinase
MTPEQWRRVSAIFHGALAERPDAQGKFLDRECGADPELRSEVERLLVAHRNAGSFGESAVFSHEHAAQAEGSSDAEPPIDARPSRAFAAAAWLAVAAATTLVFIYAAWLLVQRGGTVQAFGWEAAPRGAEWYVAVVTPNGPASGALQVGDRLVTLNGLPVVPHAGTFFGRRFLEAGDTYETVVERDGEQRAVRLAVATRTSVDELVYFGVSLVWCVIGLFVALARPQSVLARLAGATSVATGLVFLQVGVIHGAPLWQPLHGVLGFHFLARFPTGNPSRGLSRRALQLAYVVGGFAAALGLFVHGMLLIRGDAAAAELMLAHPLLFGVRRWATLLAFAIAVLGMVLVPALNYRRLTTEDQRLRVRWVVYGTILALLPQIWWTALSLYEEAAGPSALSRFDLFANAFTAAIPLVMAYAVVKHRVLDIQVVVRRGLQYLLARRALQAALVLPFLALLYIAFVNRQLTLTELATETRGYLYWIAIAGVMLAFREPIRLWLDRRFFREQYDRERLMMELLDDSRRVDSLSELSHLVSDTLLGALHPERAFVWYRDPRERIASAASGNALPPPDFPARERWLSWLELRGTAASVPLPEDAGLSPEETLGLKRRGIDVIVPIADSDDRLIGALLLGRKKSDEPYSEVDSRFLTAVAKQTAVIRENLSLRARLRDEVRVRHDVLARLDETLPDLLKECPACGACFDGAVERCPNDAEALTLSLPVSRTIDGRYRLDRSIGKGGMGAVYEARDLRLDRIVAVKIMLSRAFGQPGALRRFRREARAAARVSHPNIVTVHDVGALAGEGAYIVMERVPGDTLRATLDRAGTLSPQAAAEWFEPLLQGLAAAHAEGIVHRDLKPENVMGHREASGTLAVKILDLGLVKLRADEANATGTMTRDGVIMGTPDYMSPEQLLGREVDHRSDIFGIGVMLLEALTGARQLPDTSSTATSLGSPAQALPAAQELPPRLNDVMRRCLAAGPHDRPASVAELGAMLLPLLRTERL